jgi:type II secretory pathway component PulF
VDLGLGKRRIQLFRSLANSMKAGVSALKAVELLAAGSSGSEQSALLELRDRLRSGETLSQGLRRSPGVFPRWQAEMAAVGEATGRLDEALTAIADLLEENRAFLLGLLPSLAYPALLIHIAPVLLFAPQAFTAGTGAYVRSVASFLAALYLGAAALFFSFRLVWDHPTLRRFIPLKGALTKHQFCSHLSALIKSGVAFPRALELAADASGLDSGNPVRSRFVEGQGLAERLGKAGLFDAQELSQLQVAELSGDIDRELAHVGEQAKSSWQAGLRTVSSLLPPIVLLGVMAAAGYQIVKTYQTALGTLTELGK